MIKRQKMKNEAKRKGVEEGRETVEGAVSVTR